MQRNIDIPRGQLGAFCKEHRVRRLSLFGSVLTERFGDESDVDVLVEFEAGAEPGLFGIARMEAELAVLLGRNVDLRTAEDLSRYFRDDVLRTAEVQYASA